MSILILNGSPTGKKGNGSVLIKKLREQMQNYPEWANKDTVTIIHLAETVGSVAGVKKIVAQIKKANGFIFVTGTYWDSWGSPLQILLEKITDLEGSSAFLGKPAMVLVLNHSVGGKGVLSRLQGVLSSLGCLIPPMSGLVYSWVADQVLKNKPHTSAHEDLWSLNDLNDILENFRKVLKLNIKWKAWSVDKKEYRHVWLAE